MAACGRRTLPSFHRISNILKLFFSTGQNCFCFDRFSVFPRRRDFPYKIRDAHTLARTHGAPRRTLSCAGNSKIVDVRARGEKIFELFKIFFSELDFGKFHYRDRGRFRAQTVRGAAGRRMGPVRTVYVASEGHNPAGTVRTGKNLPQTSSSRTSQNGGCLMGRPHIHTHRRARAFETRLPERDGTSALSPSLLLLLLKSFCSSSVVR